MGGADHGYNDTDRQSEDEREQCDKRRYLQAVYDVEIALLFDKIKDQFFF